MKEIRKGVYRAELKTPSLRSKYYNKLRKEEVEKIKDTIQTGMLSSWSYHFTDNYKYVEIDTTENFYD